MINIATTVSDPSLTGTHYEGRWVSDATRDELAEYFDSFVPDARTVVKVSSLHTTQTGFFQSTHDTPLRKALQVGPARPVSCTEQGCTYRRCGASFPGLGAAGTLP